ncbi:MAG: ABC transporter ATP-binding protein [Candidatus Eremiobacteraeota bacterium]|nr:ABC transporter ATP-binding protein [Candidatus Eremiobacteraeota bacterium]
MRVTLQGIGKSYPTQGGGTFVALENVSLEIREGEFLALIGVSGCGKSTLLELIAGLQTPTAGTIAFDGIPHVGPHPRVSVVFQEDSTFPWKTVAGNIGFGLEMRGADPKARARRVEAMIDLVGLRGFEDRYPHQLSGGMRQRVAIGRTLVLDPAILLMDEPFGALDEQTRFLLGEELLRIWRESGATVVFVTHSLHEAVQLADRIAVIAPRPGRIVRIIDNDLSRPRRESHEAERYGAMIEELRVLLGLEGNREQTRA